MVTLILQLYSGCNMDCTRKLHYTFNTSASAQVACSSQYCDVLRLAHRLLPNHRHMFASIDIYQQKCPGATQTGGILCPLLPAQAACNVRVCLNRQAACLGLVFNSALRPARHASAPDGREDGLQVTAGRRACLQRHGACLMLCTKWCRLAAACTAAAVARLPAGLACPCTTCTTDCRDQHWPWEHNGEMASECGGLLSHLKPGVQASSA